MINGQDCGRPATLGGEASPAVALVAPAIFLAVATMVFGVCRAIPRPEQQRSSMRAGGIGGQPGGAVHPLLTMPSHSPADATAPKGADGFAVILDPRWIGMSETLRHLDLRLQEEQVRAPLPVAVRSILLQALHAGPHAVGLFDPEDRLAYANEAYRQGWAVEPSPDATFASIMLSCHARSCGALIETDDIGAWIARATERRRQGKESGAFEVDLHDGRWFWITERRLENGWILFIGQDITALKHNERTLRAAHDAALVASLTDPLTQIPNRRGVLRHVGALFEGRHSFFIGLVDLDAFKTINDSFGHAAGDAALVTFARCVADLPQVGFLARIAGDEFALVSPPGIDRADYEQALRTMMGLLEQPFMVLGNQVMLRASIGLAAAPAHGQDVSELLAAADTALYDAKRAGRATWRFYNPEMGRRRREEAELRRDLRTAFDRKEMVPYYQPFVSLGSGGVCGVEVLARWQHPARGVLAPDRFLPLLTTGAELTALTATLLAQAGRDMRAWKQDLRVAFNAAAQQLTCDALLPMLDRLEEHHGLPLHRLEMEITEASLMHDPGEASRAVEAVRRRGLSVALDDFGVGFSSLHHLRTIRFDRVKLDRSFVQGLDCPGNLQFLGALVRLAGDLELKVTVEGIEDEKTAAVLTELGCHTGQGFLYGRPLPASACHPLYS